ncbi:MAG: putative ABC transport system permease protein [Hyphomicrobiaceae bacterium]|jgi:putative ABC transport system permease protein
MSYITLSWNDLALAAVLLLANAVVSLRFQLGIERRIIWAGIRMVVQLSLIGLVLESLFTVVSPWWTVAVAAVMTIAAGREVRARQDRPFTGAWGYGLGTGAVMFSGTVVTLLALTTQIRPDPWYDPRYTIPILGMLLGNTLTGTALGLSRLTDGAIAARPAIEAQLALGATALDALRPTLRTALRDGMMPIINAMSAAGIVSLPGMMTGQILAGADPSDAIKYQILIMFLIAGATGLGVLAAVGGGAWRLTDSRQRLRLDRLKADT